jgi:hypothetical protein
MLESSLQCIDDGVIVVDGRGRFQFYNRAAERILGLGALETAPEGWSEAYGCFRADGVTRFPSEELPLARAMRGERVRDEEIFVRNPEIPEGVWISVSSSPVSEASGTPAGATVVFRNVTQQRVSRAREVEMHLARTIQQKLYPVKPPPLPGFDLAGATVAADSTCGDYYDFIPLNGGRLCVAVGDVSGHGFGPALLMAETRAYLRSLAKATTDLEWILERLNAFLYDDTEEERFVTLVLVLLDPGRRTLAWASAGHVPGYLLDRSGATRRVLESTGLPLGIFPEISFAASEQVGLDDGDLLVLLTDGVTEAEGTQGEFFEPERIVDLVSELLARPSQGIVSGLHEAIEAFTPEGRRRDDITAVVCKATP